MAKRKREPRESVTLDQDGNVLGGVAQAADERSFGAALWELSHPGQVQDEYRAIGKVPPSYVDIWGFAMDDAMLAAEQGRQEIVEGAKKAAFAGVGILGLVIVGVIASALIVYSPQVKRLTRRKSE